MSKLNEINFSISSNKPFLVQGGARVSAFGEVGGLSLMSVDGCFMYVSAGPGDSIQACDQNRQAQFSEKFIRLSGQMKLLTIPWGNAYFQSDGFYGDLGSTFADFSCCDVPLVGNIPLYSSKGSLGGKFNALGYWQVAADQEICIFDIACTGGGMLASDRGIIVCVTYGVTASVGWQWGGTPDFYWGCEGEPYGSKLPVFAAGGAGTRAFDVEPGRRTTSLRVRGEGGVPRLALVGPNGERLETTAGGSRFAQNGGLTPTPCPRRTPSTSGSRTRRPAAGRSSGSRDRPGCSGSSPRSRCRSRACARG